MVPTGISHEFVRNALIAQGVPPVKAAAFPGIEHELVRDALAAKALGGPGVAGTAAATAAAGKGAIAGASLTAGGGTAKALTTGGTIWSGKGLSLGLGIGLGLWGPILVGAAGVAAYYAYTRYCQQQGEGNGGATDEGFMASQG